MIIEPVMPKAPPRPEKIIITLSLDDYNDLKLIAGYYASAAEKTGKPPITGVRTVEIAKQLTQALHY